MRSLSLVVAVWLLPAALICAADAGAVVSHRLLLRGKKSIADLSANKQAVKDLPVRKATRRQAGGVQADTCSVATLPVGGSAQGSLDASDCAARDIVPEMQIPNAGARTFFADVYRIEVPRKSVIRIEMRSTQIDSYLYLLRGPSGAVLARNDNGLANRDAAVSIHLDAGTYILVATSGSAGSGAYDLNSSIEDVRSCSAQPLELDREVDGNLTDPDCRVLDTAVNSTNRSFLDIYTVEVPRRSVLRVSMASAAVDTYLILLDARGQRISQDENSGEGNNSLMVVSVEAGTYRIGATTMLPQAGTYRVSARIEDQRVCETRELKEGEVAAGELAGSECRNLDLSVPSDDATNVDLYEFELAEPRLVTLTMHSAAFDATLRVTTENGRLVTANDDFEASATDSRISVSLTAGRYRVFASSFEIESGNYDLTLSTADLRPCLVQPLAVPGNLDGSLADSDCRILDFIVPETDAAPINVYTVNVERRSVLTFEAASTAFDIGIILLDNRNQVVNVDDDGAGADSTNSKLEVMLIPGTYTLMVTNVDNRIGPYTVAVRARDPKECTITPLSFDLNADGSLGPSDCRISDVIPGFTDTSAADLYTITVTERRLVTLELTSNAFIPIVLPMDSQYLPVNGQIRVEETRSTAIFTVDPGTYFVVATSLLPDAEGPYSLKASSQPPVPEP